MTETEEPKKSIVREYGEALLIAMIVVNFARIFVFQAFKIPTGSMIDNLLVGDHIVVNKFIYGAPGPMDSLFPLREIRRGEIVVFRFPQEPTTDFVKRVVALPNETIMIRNKRVWIDGLPLDEPYVYFEEPDVFPADRRLPARYRVRDQFGPYVVPENSYFMMGDNRDRSNDSRYWGAVPRDLIKGRAFLVYWSYRGTPVRAGASPAEKLRELAHIAVDFVPATRWDRTFLVVDSRYHYREGAEAR
ncbi:MAG: signal peptidase I [Thermoanaerobaculia bacterium]